MVIALILRIIVQRSISHCTRKLVQYDILLGTILVQYPYNIEMYCWIYIAYWNNKYICTTDTLLNTFLMSVHRFAWRD